MLEKANLFFWAGYSAPKLFDGSEGHPVVGGLRRFVVPGFRV